MNKFIKNQAASFQQAKKTRNRNIVVRVGLIQHTAFKTLRKQCHKFRIREGAIL
jgi:hypothetical protein